MSVDIARLIMKIAQTDEAGEIRVGRLPIMTDEILVFLLPAFDLVDSAEYCVFRRFGGRHGS